MNLPIASLSGAGSRFAAVGVAGISGVLRVQHGRCPRHGAEDRSRIIDEVWTARARDPGQQA